MNRKHSKPIGVWNKGPPIKTSASHSLSGGQFPLLYSWKFFPNRARSHWLLRGHMTSYN